MAVRLTRRRPAAPRRTAGAVLALLVAAVPLVGVLGTPAGAAKAPKYSQPGPYAAGVTTLDLPDRKVEVWYPVKEKAAAGAVPASFDLIQKVPPAIVGLLPAGASVVVETDASRDLPAAQRKGGFPLVLMAHGTAGYREQMHFLASHLASWGFVVASPDVTERSLGTLLGTFLGTPAPPAVDDVTTMRATEALVRAEGDRAGGPLEDRVKADRVAITGQSAGGNTALRYGAEPGLVTAIPISASGYSSQTGTYVTFPDVPVMFVTGAADSVVPLANVQAGFGAANAPTRLVVIDAAGHASMAGICPIGGPGGLVGLAETNKLPVPDGLKRLASDGCANPAPDPDPAWAPINQAVTAQLRDAFGIDKRPKGLNQRTFDKFAPVAVQYQERRS
ncbi:MAG: hypothetical protein FJW95_02445 [Actinobacteria bacterium]|nr:hypothetical protein [Actinomycetota bacterium]